MVILPGRRKGFLGNDAYTKLLLHFDGADGATAFIDSSGSSHVFSRNGDAQIDTAQSVFWGSSLLLDGTGDDIYCTLDSDFNLGTGDFTIDFRTRFAVASGTMTLFDFHNDGSNYIFLSVDHSANLLSFRAVVGGVSKASYDVSWNPSADQWYHLEIGRNGSNFYAFIGGSAQSLTENTAISTNDIGVNNGGVINKAYLGAFYNTNRHNGWVEEFRLSKGICRHTADFIPQPVPYR